MRKRLTMCVAAALILAPLAGCEDDVATPGADAGVAGCEPECLVKSDELRDLSPEVPAADLAALVTGNTELATTLYAQLAGDSASQGKNLFVSPYSISLALSMTCAGARGQTEADMATALHFTLPPDRLHPAFDKLDLALASRAEPNEATGSKGFHLNIANSIWGQVGFPWEPDFLDTLAVSYGAGLRVIDFQAAPDPARLTINQWVEDMTEDRIKDLLPQGSVTDLTRMVLVNAIYFKAAWAVPFKEDKTKTADFHRLDGTTVQVPMMHMAAGDYAYHQGQGLVAVDLPYEGDELSMLLVVPDAGSFPAVEGALDAAMLAVIVDGADGVDGANGVTGLGAASVTLDMPRFGFSSEFSLKTVLTQLGMGVAFTDAADLTGMSSAGDLRITDVFHKAFVNVNEAGTEAAAATGVIAGGTSAPPHYDLTVDRPFLFLIRDRATGTVLFLGRVVDPAE